MSIKQIKEVSLNAYEAIESSAEHATLKMLIKEVCAVQDEEYHILTTLVMMMMTTLYGNHCFYVH